MAGFGSEIDHWQMAERMLMYSNLGELHEDPSAFVRQDGLGCRIAIGSYKMFPVAGASRLAHVRSHRSIRERPLGVGEAEVDKLTCARDRRLLPPQARCRSRRPVSRCGCQSCRSEAGGFVCGEAAGRAWRCVGHYVCGMMLRALYALQTHLRAEQCVSLNAFASTACAGMRLRF